MVGPSKEDLRRTPCRSTLSDLDNPGLRSVTSQSLKGHRGSCSGLLGFSCIAGGFPRLLSEAQSSQESNPDGYNSIGCANRSCGPPKPGRHLLQY